MRGAPQGGSEGRALEWGDRARQPHPLKKQKQNQIKEPIKDPPWSSHPAAGRAPEVEARVAAAARGETGGVPGLEPAHFLQRLRTGFGARECTFPQETPKAPLLITP